MSNESEGAVTHCLNQAVHSLLAKLLIALAPVVSAAALAECPVTSPSSSPVELQAGKGSTWYGSDALAVLLPSDGKWIGSPQGRFGGKLWLWRRGFEAISELRPDLVIEGMKLERGGPAERVYIKDASTGMGKDWSAMLMGLEFPGSGCWQLTATYRHIDIRHELTFVLDVVEVGGGAAKTDPASLLNGM